MKIKEERKKEIKRNQKEQFEYFDL